MSQVVIGDILPYTQAVAILNQTVFGTNWTANFPSDVVVYQTSFGDEPDDVTQILPYPAGYSVDFIGALEQVQVTLVIPAAAGDIITITRQTPADRENLYTNTNFTPTMLNNDFEILTLVDQQAQLVDQKIGPRYNYSAIIRNVVDTILPILGPGQTWMKDAGNDAIVAVDFVAPSGGNISSWQTITAANITIAGGKGIIANNSGSPLQVVLPAVFNAGDECAVMGLGSAGWTLVANALQTIKFGSETTSTAGSISSDIQYANIFVRGLVANTTWTVELVNSNPTYL